MLPSFIFLRVGVPVVVHGGVRTIWLLHLFSGRRRRGDCHFWIEHLGDFIPGFDIKILSVDTAIDAELGNLDRGPHFSRLLQIIRKRHFAAGLTGPACETFSAARHIVLEGGRHPRPLRSAAMPWIHAGRSCRELFQTLIGSRLLLHSLWLELELVLSGGGSLMEHPKEHPDSTRVSIWRLLIHRLWHMQLPGAIEHHVEQWQFGSGGVKPTTLRALNLGPSHLIATVFSQGTDPTLVRPSCPLKGRDSSGRFRTAAAKEYPSALCRSLVLGVLTGLRHRIQTEGIVEASPLSTDEHAWIAALHQASNASSLSGHFLPDFQG